MALHQYTLFFLPRTAILKHYGEIPDQLEHNTQAWEDYIGQTEDFSDDPKFEDAFSTNWWLGTTILKENLLPFLERFGGILDWTKNSEGFRTYGNNSTDDISVHYDEQTHIVEELSCRIDVTQLNKQILSTVMEIAHNFDCLLLNSKAELFEADIDELKKRISVSNAGAFLANPNQFFTALSGGKIKPE